MRHQAVLSAEMIENYGKTMQKLTRTCSSDTLHSWFYFFFFLYALYD